jgi:HTH-type transcriptional regulator/antitoxin HigA
MEAIMDTEEVSEISSLYEALSARVPLKPIRTQQDYDHAVAALDRLLDAGAADEGHLLADLVDMLGQLIGHYDEAHYPVNRVSPVASLRLLMEQHALSQSDLPEVGTQGVISEVLSGKRDLNVRQIKALSKRFKVPHSVFLG